MNELVDSLLSEIHLLEDILKDLMNYVS